MNTILLQWIMLFVVRSSSNAVPADLWVAGRAALNRIRHALRGVKRLQAPHVEVNPLSKVGALCRPDIAALYPYLSKRIAGWRAILRMALSSSCLPGGTLCQGETPEGCGSGIRSNRCPPRSIRNLRPMTFSSLAYSMNWEMANLPTGITRRGFRILISSFVQSEQLRISWNEGTRSPPPAALPGKHLQTAAK
jgi:hypothetical protein